MSCNGGWRHFGTERDIDCVRRYANRGNALLVGLIAVSIALRTVRSVTMWLACIATVLLAGCTHAPLVLQVYGDSGLGREIDAFAASNQVRVERPPVMPAQPSSAVTIVHGSHWRSWELAAELAEVLRLGGTEVTVRPSRLQNHVVTGRNVGVFIRRSADVDLPEDDDTSVSQLICSPNEEAEAIILLFSDGELEIHTYLWRDDQVTGRNYSGHWEVAGDNTVHLKMEGHGTVSFRPADGRCAPIPNGRSCRSDLKWISGKAFPVLTGCTIAVRDILVVAPHQ